MNSFEYALRYIPMLAAYEAVKKNALREQHWARLLLSRANCSEVQSCVIAFLAPTPPKMIPGNSYVRVASRLHRVEATIMSHDILVQVMIQSMSMRCSLRHDLRNFIVLNTPWHCILPWC